MVTDVQQGSLALRWCRHSQTQSCRYISEQLAAVDFPNADVVASDVEGVTEPRRIAAHRTKRPILMAHYPTRTILATWPRAVYTICELRDR